MSVLTLSLVVLVCISLLIAIAWIVVAMCSEQRRRVERLRERALLAVTNGARHAWR